MPFMMDTLSGHFTIVFFLPTKKKKNPSKYQSNRIFMLQWSQYLQLLFIASPRCGCGSCLQSRIGLHRWWSRHSIEGEPWGRIWGFLMERVLRKVIFRFWCFGVPQYSWGGAGSISKWSVGHTAYPSWAFFQISLGRPHPQGTTWVHPCIWENYSSGNSRSAPA